MPSRSVSLLRWALTNFLPKLPQTMILLTSASQVAGIIGVSHHSWSMIYYYYYYYYYYTLLDLTWENFVEDFCV
jgi:hypothetical protein